MTIKVGFIGLGIMGKPMSKNLLKAGYSLVVSDRNPEAIADVIAAGGCIGGHLWTGIPYGTRCASRRSSHWAAAQREP